MTECIHTSEVDGKYIYIYMYTWLAFASFSLFFYSTLVWTIHMILYTTSTSPTTSPSTIYSKINTVYAKLVNKTDTRARNAITQAPDERIRIEAALRFCWATI